jgi:hypothetical protein
MRKVRPEDFVADRPLPRLSLPEPSTPIIEQPVRQIRCLVRQRFVRLTPEEWVRQSMLAYLIEQRGYPAALIRVEGGHRFQEMARRTDAVAHDRSGKAILLVECKAPDVPIDQSTFDQAGRYNLNSEADVVVVTNGLQHFCYRIDREGQAVTFLEDVPAFSTLS